MSGHEGHVPGAYSLLCRACRIGADLQRIEEMVRPVPRDDAFVGHARCYLKRFPWTEGHVRALEMAANAGLSLRDVVSAVHEARAEVGRR
jgi:hypothetical protein